MRLRYRGTIIFNFSQKQHNNHVCKLCLLQLVILRKVSKNVCILYDVYELH